MQQSARQKKVREHHVTSHQTKEFERGYDRDEVGENAAEVVKLVAKTALRLPASTASWFQNLGAEYVPALLPCVCEHKYIIRADTEQ